MSNVLFLLGSAAYASYTKVALYKSNIGSTVAGHKVDRIVKQNPNQNHNHNADSHGAIYVVSRLDMISIQDNKIFFHVY